MKLPGMMKSCVLIAALMLLALPVIAHGQGAAQVTIKDFSFDPGTITIARGGTVTWTNQDSVTHTVKFGIDESPGLHKGQTYTKTFGNAGTFDYACGIHPFMTGKVIVK